MLLTIRGMEIMCVSEDILHKSRLGKFEEGAARFTSSVDIDPRLFRAVIDINCAHVLMLSKQRILSREKASALLRGLRAIPIDMEFSDALEDVHMNIEARVISTLGKDIGGMLNLAKSRNDQVATALRMVLREELQKIAEALIKLESQLLSQARRNAAVPMPGYTHLQRAQPLTVGHHLLAHFDSLQRDMDRLIECYARVNESPMGSGALASTGFPIDRKLTASLLGFDGLVENSLDAVSSRDFATEAIFDCAQILGDLSKFSEELVLWTTTEFSFAEIANSYTSTSSMMPQKKNPVVAEIARAKAAQVIGDLVGALGILKSMPMGYNSDLQELTRNLWSATDKTLDSLVIFGEMANAIQFRKDFLTKLVRGDETLFATEIADYLVKEHKIPFREAHGAVGTLVRESIERGVSLRSLGPELLQEKLGVSIPNYEFDTLFDPIAVLSKRRALGAPNPKLVEIASEQRKKLLATWMKKWSVLNRRLRDSKKRLESEIRKIELKPNGKRKTSKREEVKQ
jgi:argininosuccinate lyase